MAVAQLAKSANSSRETTTDDQAGRFTQRVSVSGVEAFDYDTNGRLWRHRLDGVTLATVTYNTAGELRTVAYGNGTVLADLDATGRRFADPSVRELTFTGPAGTVTSNTITARDRDGRVTAETVDGSEYRYGYDASDRLVRAEFGPTGFTTPTDDWRRFASEGWVMVG